MFLVIGLPLVVNAHIRMLQSSPEPGSNLSSSPEKVSITFVGSVEPAFSKIEVYDGKGNRVSKKTTFSDNDTTMEVELEKNLPPGVYTVKWKCVSIDGHKQKVECSFRGNTFCFSSGKSQHVKPSGTEGISDTALSS
ncbi:MAG: hypothetical protein GXO97_03815 [Nitrospirae bacterium]|nr:hypothetical protein [Nitrospirota bacterium]